MTAGGYRDVSGMIRICTKQIPPNPMRIVEAINNDITNSTAWVPITMATFYHVEMICQEKMKQKSLGKLAKELSASIED